MNKLLLKRWLFLITVLLTANMALAQNYIVSGCPLTQLNGTYVYHSDQRGKPYYQFLNTDDLGTYALGWDGMQWHLGQEIEPGNILTYFTNMATDATPPASGWEGFGTTEPMSVLPEGKKLIFSTLEFNESTFNNGTIPTIITITHNGYDGETFTGSVNDDYIAAGKATVSNVPAGLTAAVKLTSATTVEFKLTGTASSHLGANSISNLTIAFANSAFSGGDASAVANSTKSSLEVKFIEWVYVGTQGFSADRANNTSLAYAPDGTPYVLFTDWANSMKATVMKYDGASWVNVGTPGFTTGTAGGKIAFGPDGLPYVAYQDGGNSKKATVMKYNGSAWVTVGTAGFSAGEVQYVSLDIATDGTLYVAYKDVLNSYKATVMKYNGSAWVGVGIAGFSAGQAYYTSLALGADGNPYVAYQDASSSNKATVMKYDGSAWAAVGTAGFTGSTADYTSLAIASDGTPYIAYEDFANGTKASVMKFDGANWDYVGSPGFSTGYINANSLVFAPDGSLYFAFKDNGTNNKARVMKFNGTDWEDVGNPAFSESGIDHISLAFDADGNPIVAFSDESNGGKASVMKYVVPLPSITWTGTAWDNGTPDASTDAIIAGNYSEATGFTCKDLTVNNGFTLNIAANQTVTVEGDLVNNGTIWLKSSGSLPTGALLNKGTLTNNGSMKAEKRLSANTWHFLGSPMTANIPVESVLLNDYVYSYTRVISAAWDDLAYGDNLIAKTGYLVQTVQSGGKNITLNGNFATGTVDYTLATDGDKWNLVANPFPTPIDLNDVAIIGAVSSFYLWEGANYNAYVKGGASGFRYVPNMTSFFVGASGATKAAIPTLTIGNAAKESNQVYIATKSSNTELIHFTVNNSIGQKDNVYIELNDTDVKALKMFSLINTAPQAYIVEDGENISIKSYLSSKDERIIPIAFESEANGTYTFEMEEFTITDKAYLRDLQTGAWFSLNESTSYEFTHNKANDKLRFELVLNPKTTNFENVETKIAQIYANKDVIYVNLAQAQNTTISVFDLSGRKVKELNTSATSVQINDLQNGTYLVRVNSDKGNAVQKVFIND